MLKALISITAALAIFAAGSAIVTESSLAMGQASGAHGKSAVPNSSARVKTAKKSRQRRWRGNGFLVPVGRLSSDIARQVVKYSCD